MTNPEFARRSARPAPPSLIEQSMAVLRLLARALVDRLRLLGLELRRAGRDLALAAALVVVALVLAGTAWVGLWLGIVMALRGLGLGWPSVVAITILINVAGAAAALWGTMRLARGVSLAATLRHLHFSDDADSQPMASTASTVSPTVSPTLSPTLSPMQAGSAASPTAGVETRR